MDDLTTANGLTIRRELANPLPDGSIPFTEMITTAEGDFISMRTGFLAPGSRELERPTRKRGRPRKETQNVAIMLHETMAKCLKDASLTRGENARRRAISLTAARLDAAHALKINLGGHPGNAANYIRDQAKAATVDSRFDRLLFFEGDEKGNGRLAILLHETASVIAVQTGLMLRGHAWICQWGCKDASLRHINTQIPVIGMSDDVSRRLSERADSLDPSTDNR